MALFNKFFRRKASDVGNEIVANAVVTNTGISAASKMAPSNALSSQSSETTFASFTAHTDLSIRAGGDCLAAVWSAVNLISDAVASRQFQGTQTSLDAIRQGDGVYRGPQFIKALVEGALLSGNSFCVRDGSGLRLTSIKPSVKSTAGELTFSLQFPSYLDTSEVAASREIPIARVGHVRYGRIIGGDQHALFAEAVPADLLKEWQALVLAFLRSERDLVLGANKLLATLTINEQFHNEKEAENNLKKLIKILKAKGSGKSVALPRGYKAERLPRVEVDTQFQLVFDNFVSEVARAYHIPREMLGATSSRPAEGIAAMFQRQAVQPMVNQVETVLRQVLNDDSFRVNTKLNVTTDQAAAVMQLAQTGVVGDIELREILGLPEQRRGDLPQTAGAPPREDDAQGA